jgi:hypothetical protein
VCAQTVKRGGTPALEAFWTSLDDAMPSWRDPVARQRENGHELRSYRVLDRPGRLAPAVGASSATAAEHSADRRLLRLNVSLLGGRPPLDPQE